MYATEEKMLGQKRNSPIHQHLDTYTYMHINRKNTKTLCFWKFANDDESTRIICKILNMLRWRLLRRGIIIKLTTQRIYATQDISNTAQFLICAKHFGIVSEKKEAGIIQFRTVVEWDRERKAADNVIRLCSLAPRHLFNSAPYFLFLPFHISQ